MPIRLLPPLPRQLPLPAIIIIAIDCRHFAALWPLRADEREANEAATLRHTDPRRRRHAAAAAIYSRRLALILRRQPPQPTAAASATPAVSRHDTPAAEATYYASPPAAVPCRAAIDYATAARRRQPLRLRYATRYAIEASADFRH